MNFPSEGPSSIEEDFPASHLWLPKGTVPDGLHKKPICLAKRLSQSYCVPKELEEFPQQRGVASQLSQLIFSAFRRGTSITSKKKLENHWKPTSSNLVPWKILGAKPMVFTHGKPLESPRLGICCQGTLLPRSIWAPGNGKISSIPNFEVYDIEINWIPPEIWGCKMAPKIYSEISLSAKRS